MTDGAAGGGSGGSGRADPRREGGGLAVVEIGGRVAPGPPRAAIVVGFDRSAAALAVLGTAADLGTRLGAELHVVHAVDLADYPVDPDADDWEEQARTTLDDEHERVAAALAAYPGAWSYVAVRAEPADALDRLATALDALMIVVGVRSHGWRHVLEHLLSPSVSHRLLDCSHTPVLVVAPADPGRAARRGRHA